MTDTREGLKWIRVLGLGAALLYAIPAHGWAQDPASDSVSPEEIQEESSSISDGQDAESDEEAPVPSPDVVDVEFRGLKGVSRTLLEGKVRARVGDPLDRGVLNEDLKRLYDTHYFSDVQVEVESRPQGVAVVFVVIEKPHIVEIVLEGNKKFRTDKLVKEMKTKVGDILDPRVLNEDIQMFKQMYEEKGFRQVNIEREVSVDDNGDATLYILFDEGQKVKITRIRVEGNQGLKEKDILKQMKTKKGGWFRSGVFKEEQFEVDLERVRQYYQQNGYADSQIAYDTQLRPKGRMEIVLKVEEGPQYKTGTVEFVGNELFPEQELLSRLMLVPGKPWSQTQLRLDVRALQDYYFERGYITTEISVDTRVDDQAHQVSLTYRIEEHELVYVDKIKIIGNEVTHDKVIRRELRVRPGEPFEGAQLNRSKERLIATGIFEDVTYDTQDTPDPARKDLVVSVKEQRTGEFSFGAGYSSTDQFVGFVDVTQRNFDITNFPRFVGAGQIARARVELGTLRNEYEINFTEPWFLDRPLSAGFDLYNRNIEFEDYDLTRTGGDVRLGKEFSDELRVDVAQKLENVEIDEISIDAATDVTAERGNTWLSGWKAGLTYDRRNSILNPTRGFLGKLGGEVVGGFLGGDRDFYKLTESTSFYFQNPWKKTHVLELSQRAGVSEEIDDTVAVPIYERFYAGGASSIRGYNLRRVGPKSGGDPIGGNTLFVATAEYTFPIVSVLKGATFFDVGNVYSDSYDFNLGDLKSGIGAGLRVRTPIGPVRVDYGYPLDPDEGEKDDNGRFYFSIDRGF